MDESVALKEDLTLDEKINEAVLLSRSALLTLVPTFQKSDIKWDALEDYDDFFALSEALFNLITLTKVQNIAEENGLQLKDFAQYGFFHKDYSNKSYIEAVHNGEDVFVFNYFGSMHKPFDSAYCVKLDANGKAEKTDIRLACENVTFRLKI